MLSVIASFHYALPPTRARFHSFFFLRKKGAVNASKLLFFRLVSVDAPYFRHRSNYSCFDRSLKNMGIASYGFENKLNAVKCRASAQRSAMHSVFRSWKNSVDPVKKTSYTTSTHAKKEASPIFCLLFLKKSGRN